MTSSDLLVVVDAISIPEPTRRVGSGNEIVVDVKTSHVRGNYYKSCEGDVALTSSSFFDSYADSCPIPKLVFTPSG